MVVADYSISSVVAVKAIVVTVSFVVYGLVNTTQGDSLQHCFHWCVVRWQYEAEHVASPGFCCRPEQRQRTDLLPRCRMDQRLGLEAEGEVWGGFIQPPSVTVPPD